jgi:ribosome-associated toxin RatA of RatAB toxin-antitoxin module
VSLRTAQAKFHTSAPIYQSLRESWEFSPLRGEFEFQFQFEFEFELGVLRRLL